VFLSSQVTWEVETWDIMVPGQLCQKDLVRPHLNREKLDSDDRCTPVISATAARLKYEDYGPGQSEQKEILPKIPGGKRDEVMTQEVECLIKKKLQVQT
jgi:hypothetical protein